MKIKFLYFFICLNCITAYKSSIHVYAANYDTNITTSEAVCFSNKNITTSQAVSYEETNPALKNSDNNIIGVSNSDEFISNLSKGNNIILNNNIELNSYCTFTTNSPIFINANGYGIKVKSGNLINFNGPFKFSGCNESIPMFTVDSGSLLSINNSALTIDNDNSVGIYLNSGSYLSLFNSSIIIDGNNSTGIYSNTEIDNNSSYINYSTICINGNNSIGIDSSKKVNLFFNNLLTSGENSKPVVSNKVILDSCSTDIIPHNAQIIKRYASNTSVYPYQAPVNSSKINLPNYVTFILKDKENSAPDEEITFNVIWDNTVQYDTIGEYKIRGELINLHPHIQIKELVEDFPEDIENTIYIKDPDILDITYIQNVSSFNDLITITIEFLNPVEPSDNNILYCSMDNGKTWQEYSEAYDLNDTQLNISNLQFSKDYLFQYVLSDGTKSNYLKININPNDTYVVSDYKGDRDGGDLGKNESPLITIASETELKTPSKDNEVYKNNQTENTAPNNNSRHKSSSHSKENTINDESFVNNNSNLIIMDTAQSDPLFVSETLKNKNESAEEKTVLSGYPNLNNDETSNTHYDNNNISSNTEEKDTAYEKDSAQNVYAHKSDSNVQASEERKNNKVKESKKDTDLNKENMKTHIPSTNKTKQNVYNKSFKKYALPAAILSFLCCTAGFIFIKKRFK